MLNIIKFTIISLGFSLAIILGLSVISYSVSRTETAECFKWQNYAKKYPKFYLTEWQKKQCDNKKIQIDAPISNISN